MKIAALYPWGHLTAERQAGASVRFGLMLDHLASRGNEIRVVAPGEWSSDWERGGVRYFSFRPSRLERRIVRVARALFRAFTFALTLGRVGQDDFMLWYHLEWRLQPSLRRRIEEMTSWADVIIVEYPFWVGAARRYRRAGTPVIVTAHDVLSNQVRPRILRWLTIAVERSGLRQADKAVCVSAPDQATFRRWGIEAEVIPHAVDTSTALGYPDPHSTPDTAVRKPLCLFVGSAFEANIRAAEAIRKIARAVSERYEADLCDFIVVGGCCPPGREFNFEALGLVDTRTLGVLYRAATVVLVPLPFGTGSSVKTIEAMGYGKVVLGTTVAFRGYPVSPDVDCVVENDLDAYPAQIAALLSDGERRRRIEAHARQLAESYGSSRVNERYVTLIRSAIPEGKRPREAVAPATPSQADSKVGRALSTCRVCDATDLRPVLDLGEQPWCNNFLRERELGREPRYPLRLVRCESCATAQLDYTVPKEVMFSDHTYLSGTTRTLTQHFLDVAIDVDSRFFAGTPGKTVLDIGSNDGSQLKQYRRLGYDVLGVEPAAKPSALATRDGIPTVREFFNLESARRLGRRFHVVNAAGVFFHLEELHSATDGIREVLRDDGVFVVQFLYMKSILENVAFDQIYHEHLLYYTLRTIDVLLKRHGLELFDAYVSPIHGGSIIGFATHAGSRAPTARLEQLRVAEDEAETNEIATYGVFAERIEQMKADTLRKLWTAKAEGKRIYGFGAPAKGNTLLNYFRIGPEVLDYLVERNALRRGLYSPGMHIPIVLESELRYQPDLYYVLAWNFRDEILHRNRHLIERGVEFYFPVEPRRVVS